MMTTALPPTPRICAAEGSACARVGGVLFRHRGWLPVLFLGIPLLVPGHMTIHSWIAGGLLIIMGEAWRLAGVAAAGTTTRRRSRNVQRLVTYGPFARSRNPLYNGNFLIWMGFTVLSGVYWFLPIAILLFAIEYSLIVRYEEAVLESIFDAEYLAYKARVPRWLPQFGGTVDNAETGNSDWREAWRSETSTFAQYAVLLIAFAVKAQYLQ